MTSEVHTCRPEDSLHRAARLMWEGDCGSVPVVDRNQRVVGMLTDRDVCMAALLGGRPLGELLVAHSMTRDVVTCRSTDTSEDVLERLAAKQLHRLPVVDEHDRLVGVVTLADLVRRDGGERAVAAYAAVHRPRRADVAAATPAGVSTAATGAGASTTTKTAATAAKATSELVPKAAAAKPEPKASQGAAKKSTASRKKAATGESTGKKAKSKTARKSRGASRKK